MLFNQKDTFVLDFTLSLYFPRSSFAFVFNFEYFSSLSFSFCLASNCLSRSYWKDIKSVNSNLLFHSFLWKIYFFGIMVYLLFFLSNAFSCLFFCVTFRHFRHRLKKKISWIFQLNVIFTGINIFIIIILAVLMKSYREEKKSCNRVAIRYSNKALRG